MGAEQQLARETQLRMPYAVIAGLGGIALLAAQVLQVTSAQPKVDEQTLILIQVSMHGPLFVLSTVINGAGLIALSLTLSFLFRAARIRRPELPAWMRSIAILGAVVATLLGIAFGVAYAVKAHQFVIHTPESYVQANAVGQSAVIKVTENASLAGLALLATGWVMVSLHAMRVGLLTKFMGYLGMVAAVSMILPLFNAFLPGSSFIVQVFWLVAIAFVLSGRWRNEPEAWRAGKAVPWPSAAEVREQRQRAAGRGDGRGKPAGRPAGKAASGDSQTVTTVTRTRSTTPKRKRKRRK